MNIMNCRFNDAVVFGHYDGMEDRTAGGVLTSDIWKVSRLIVLRRGTYMIHQESDGTVDKCVGFLAAHNERGDTRG